MHDVSNYLHFARLGGEVGWTPRTSRRSDPVRHHRLSLVHKRARSRAVRAACRFFATAFLRASILAPYEHE